MRTVDERAADLSSVLKTAMDSAGINVRVAIPGIVQSWNADEQTVTVQPAIREKVSFGGAGQEMNIPVLTDVPVVMPRAGGYSLLMVPKKGDECLVVFGDMCMDSWWQSGGIQSQADSRRHDLSDGFAILGCWSQPNKPSFPTSGCRLQNDEGSAGVSISGGTVDIFGTVTINGDPYLTHKHSGVDSGSSNTGGVV